MRAREGCEVLTQAVRLAPPRQRHRRELDTARAQRQLAAGRVVEPLDQRDNRRFAGAASSSLARGGPRARLWAA